MTGLEKILAQVSSEAQAAADETIRKAREQAEQTAAQIAAEADEQCTRIQEQASRQEQDALHRARSAARLQKRQTLLAARQELISQTLEMALTHLRSLPDSAYFEAVTRLAVRYALPGRGMACFGAADLSRIPADYENTLNKALPEGCSLQICPTPYPVNSGFVLLYGGIEENCSFEALMAARREEMRDRANELLFSGT